MIHRTSLIQEIAGPKTQAIPGSHRSTAALTSGSNVSHFLFSMAAWNRAACSAYQVQNAFTLHLSVKVSDDNVFFRKGHIRQEYFMP